LRPEGIPVLLIIGRGSLGISYTPAQPTASIKEHSLDSAHNYEPLVTREYSKQRNKLSTPSRSASPGIHNP
jgi:hypothetical protein